MVMRIVSMLIILMLIASPANAGFLQWCFPKVIHTVTNTTTTTTTTTAKAPVPVGTSGQVWSCWMNPAAVLICVVVVGITVQTVKEIKQGCTNDINLAKFWMTYPCRNVVMARG